ncbi:hypothetical protein C0J50_11207 [Silurus asotus]|uniref:Uncharacterized protein n=1 Tax=Silurus asotus TaxID=30991 RepID=A0AAD5AC21_SILAS|nr:hypothetical protein C0J50_11207 [Silurus asotus]
MCWLTMASSESVSYERLSHLHGIKIAPAGDTALTGSAECDQAGDTVLTGSAEWDQAGDTVLTGSAEWDQAGDTVLTGSAEWDQAGDTVLSGSAECDQAEGWSSVEYQMKAVLLSLQL